MTRACHACVYSSKLNVQASFALRLALPELAVEKVNSKTVERLVPVPAALAHSIHFRMTKAPFTSTDKSKKWPLEGQPLDDPDACLFPGLVHGGGRPCRNWRQPVTARAFNYKLRGAAEVLSRQRQQARQLGEQHAFEHYDLTRLGSHSFKKTTVSLLSDKGFSMSIASALTGTSVRTLSQTYDQPTSRRTRSAVEDAILPCLRGPLRDWGKCQCNLYISWY